MITFEPRPGGGKTGTYRCPVCARTFYGGGEALHLDDCPEKPNGYQNCVYRFVPRDVERTLEGYCVVEGLTVELLRHQFPDHIPKQEGDTSSP